MEKKDIGKVIGELKKQVAEKESQAHLRSENGERIGELRRLKKRLKRAQRRRRKALAAQRRLAERREGKTRKATAEPKKKDEGV